MSTRRVLILGIAAFGFLHLDTTSAFAGRPRVPDAPVVSWSNISDTQIRGSISQCRIEGVAVNTPECNQRIYVTGQFGECTDTPQALVNLPSAAAESWTLSGLEPGQQYLLWARAWTAEGGVCTAVASVKTDVLHVTNLELVRETRVPPPLDAYDAVEYRLSVGNNTAEDYDRVVVGAWVNHPIVWPQESEVVVGRVNRRGGAETRSTDTFTFYKPHGMTFDFSSFDFSFEVDSILSSRAEVAPTGSSVTLPGASAIVQFAPGSFSAPTFVSLASTFTYVLEDNILETAAVFRPYPVVSRELRIQTGGVSPTNDTVVTVTLPQSFLNGILSTYHIRAFARFVGHELSWEPGFISFDPVESQFNATSRTITLTLPPSAFAPENTSDPIEAVVIFAGTPANDGAALAAPLEAGQETQAGVSPTCLQGLMCPLVGGCNVAVLGEFTPDRNGRPHRGVDYVAARGTTVRAASAGIVERSYLSTCTPKCNSGNTIIVRHIDGSASRYLHLERRDVVAGAFVNEGETLGTSDNTGDSRGDHLHFEYVRTGDITTSSERIDPDQCIGRLLSGVISVGSPAYPDSTIVSVWFDTVRLSRPDWEHIQFGMNDYNVSGVSSGSHSILLRVEYIPFGCGSPGCRSSLRVVLPPGMRFSNGTSQWDISNVLLDVGRYFTLPVVVSP